jgi:hypothetical protein
VLVDVPKKFLELDKTKKRRIRPFSFLAGEKRAGKSADATLRFSDGKGVDFLFVFRTVK